MATAKKTTTKKKPATKRAPSRKTSRTTVRTKRATSKRYKSFKVTRDHKNFFTFKFTDQTVYWLVFTLAILALGLWIVNLQLKVNEIYDKIDLNNYANESSMMRSNPYQ